MRISGQGVVPALVLARGYTGLGVLRSLALAGIPSYIACPVGDVAAASRWYRPLPGLQDWDGSVGPDTMEQLRSLPLETAVLIPGCDDAALCLSDVPSSDLSDRFPVSSSSRATLELLQDKSRFGELLSRADIPHPRTFTIHGHTDIDAIPFDELDRVFLKPTDSQLFSEVTGAKGVWAANRAACHAAWTQLDRQGFTVVAQEYVPGGADDHYFIDGFRDRDGQLAGLFARRRLRIYPADFGNSSYCESIALDDVVEALGILAGLLSTLHYRGIFSAEFKLDARYGVFRILEINTRAWWYVEFAARCGVNVCRMAYEDALGTRVASSARNYPVGAGCVNLGSDIRSVYSQRRSSREPLRQTLSQWKRAHFHVLRWDDPVPALSMLLPWLNRLMLKLKRLKPVFFDRSRYTATGLPRSPEASAPPRNR